ncbi:glycosyltransferase involved in cell wall biosynthesis [Acetobacter aceti NBRC 14818]|uniref:Glycosyl transferase n=1 Tax=Acetobacter aceti NBRC 14818 TaxID=887700 RepID=A0AB33IHL4_ACEAC|nr:glycosyltransferase family 4 protein [Acetobacter aceti]TCS29424.1 glycosyltransferase involved in cell wall biosynthesis [Acetobacter aceti NBRC 14818]BCK76553.1 glycosyl transferase [Acetobacter aceti NBRC 14818]GAN57278.1 glycosyl transferase [Acetobacter aceti NBRC 14818]
MNALTRRPVILQVLPALDAGGVERGTVEMVQAIAQAGGIPLVASAEGRLAPMIAYYGGRHIPLELGRKSPFAILRNARKLKAIIRKEKVSLVHARSRAPAWAAKLACRSRKVPFITTWHGVHNASFRGKKAYNAVLAAGDRVIAISQFIADRLRREYEVGEDRLRIIPRGADTVQFDPENVRGDRVSAVLNSWNIEDDGAAIILMPARLTEWKGQGLLLEALSIMIRERWTTRPWVCVFAGETPEKSGFPAQLKSRVVELGLTPHVRFGGHCTDMPAALALSEMVVVPSLRPEPFGRVVVEAQAMARPVIVAAHGAAVETVRHGETGLLFPPGDARVLAEMIAATLEATDEERMALGHAARRNVLEHYTTRSMQQATLAVYDEVLGGELAGRFVERGVGE